MTIRKWIYLFFTTLLIGGLLGAVLGLAFNWQVFTGGSFLNLLFGVIQTFGYGLMFSVYSQAGYFAYLTIHRLGLGIFGSTRVWNGVLLVLTAVVVFDLFYFRNVHSANGYFFAPLFLIVFGLFVAYLKAKETNRYGFIPTLFLMITITVLEWYYPLKTNSPSYLWPTLAVLLACNTWQVLVLHRLIEKPKKG